MTPGRSQICSPRKVQRYGMRLSVSVSLTTYALKRSEGFSLIYSFSAGLKVRARSIRSMSVNITKPVAPNRRSSAEAMTARWIQWTRSIPNKRRRRTSFQAERPLPLEVLGPDRAPELLVIWHMVACQMPRGGGAVNHFHTGAPSTLH